MEVDDMCVCVCVVMLCEKEVEDKEEEGLLLAYGSVVWDVDVYYVCSKYKKYKRVWGDMGHYSIVRLGEVVVVILDGLYWKEMCILLYDLFWQLSMLCEVVIRSRMKW